MFTKSDNASTQFPLPSRLLPVEAAALWAGVSDSTFARWIAGGLRIHQERPGKKRLVLVPDDILAYLQKRQAPSLDLDTIVNDTVAGVLQGGRRAR